MQCEQWTLSTFQHREFCHPRLVCELSGSGGVRVFVILLEIIRVVFYMVHKLVLVAQDFVSRINVCLLRIREDGSKCIMLLRGVLVQIWTYDLLTYFLDEFEWDCVRNGLSSIDTACTSPLWCSRARASGRGAELS